MTNDFTTRAALQEVADNARAYTSQMHEELAVILKTCDLQALSKLYLNLSRTLHRWQRVLTTRILAFERQPTKENQQDVEIVMEAYREMHFQLVAAGGYLDRIVNTNPGVPNG